MKQGSERRWFVEMEGRAQGPFTQAQVQDLARLKRINPMTRIFTEGDVRWRLMNEFDEFKIVPESSSSTQNREWVVLKRKTLKEAELSQNKFDQVGPFTVDEINEQLKTGDLSYNDYAWKKGFQRWAKLEALVDFNHTVKAPIPAIPETPPVPMAFLNEPRLDLDQDDQNELDHFTATNSRALDFEIKPSKPAKAAKPVGGKKNSVRAVEEQIGNQLEQKIDESESSSDTSVNIVPGISRGRKIVRVALAAAAACVVTFVAYDFVKENYGPLTPVDSEVSAPQAAVAPQPPPQEPTLSVPSEPQQEVAQTAPATKQLTNQLPAKAVAPKTQTPKQAYTKADFEMPKNPRIDFEVIRPDTIGQVVISTNAPVNFPVEVKVTGKSGQILRYTSYSQVLKVQRQGGEVPSIQLSTLKLPFGTYTIQAKFGEVTKQKTVFFGVKDAKFQKSLDAQLKKVSTEQIIEKKMVFYFLRELEDRAKKLEIERAKAAKSAAGWSQAYSAWRKDVSKVNSKSFAAIKGTTGRDVAYPEVIAKAKELGQSLLKQGEELNAAVAQNRYLSSSGMGPILSAIRDFRKEVATLSRY